MHKIIVLRPTITKQPAQRKGATFQARPHSCRFLSHYKIKRCVNQPNNQQCVPLLDWIFDSVFRISVSQLTSQLLKSEKRKKKKKSLFQCVVYLCSLRCDLLKGQDYVSSVNTGCTIVS